jgi:hypothetical protein
MYMQALRGGTLWKWIKGLSWLTGAMPDVEIYMSLRNQQVAVCG